MLQIYMKTDIGLVRHSNQDAVKGRRALRKYRVGGCMRWNGRRKR